MAPTKRSGKGKTTATAKQSIGQIPTPFKKPNEVLAPFIEGLSPKHIYITHIDSHPAPFKRKMFLVPVGMNIVIVALFCLRMWWISPWYWKLVQFGLGYQNEMSFPVASSSWYELAVEIFKRGFVMFLDFVLFVFVWPWPVEFVFGGSYGSPIRWRWNVGFRDKEIYVRRSREWDTVLGDIFTDTDSMKILVGQIQAATSPLLQEQKTGYLLMSGQWDLDWVAQVEAHAMVDKKEMALEAFKTVVLVYHQDFGWLCYDTKAGDVVEEDSKRRQVFAFRDALTAMGKENLFYRWVELVQFEATQPGGFGPEKQEAAAKRIRELFEAENVNFDDLWKEAVGSL